MQCKSFRVELKMANSKWTYNEAKIGHLFWMGGGGGEWPAAHNSKTIYDIKIKFGRIIGNHKLINLA